MSSIMFSLNWILTCITSDDTEDEDANDEYIEETSRDVVMVATAKLVVNNIGSEVECLQEQIKYLLVCKVLWNFDQRSWFLFYGCFERMCLSFTVVELWIINNKTNNYAFIPLCFLHNLRIGK